VSNAALAAGCVAIFFDAGPHALLLLLFETWVTFLEAVRAFFKTWLHFRYAHEGEHSDRKANLSFYADFVTEGSLIIVNAVHYLHIWYLNGVRGGGGGADGSSFPFL
jgi:hypothetical protein